MAIEQHLAILSQGVENWNRWRRQQPEFRPDLSKSNLINRDLSRADFSGTDLSGADLSKAQLSHASLHGANLESATLILADLLGAILNESNLSGASLFGAFLFGTRLKGADLSGANLMGASLMGADLSAANLTGAHLMGANFHDANLTKADLTNANLTAASLVGAKIADAIFSNCSIYGVSAFNLEGTPATQSNVIITPVGESPIAIDDLETAQFIYLLLSGNKLPRLLESVQSRFVLVVGNFRAEREEILRSIQASLQEQSYTSIVAHLHPPLSRDLTHQILLLCRFVRFVIADVTESKPVIRLLSNLSSVPVQPIFQTGGLDDKTLALIAGLADVRDPLTYRNPEDLRVQLGRTIPKDYR